MRTRQFVLDVAVPPKPSAWHMRFTPQPAGESPHCFAKPVGVRAAWPPAPVTFPERFPGLARDCGPLMCLGQELQFTHPFTRGL
jgi:hypothetical protein